MFGFLKPKDSQDLRGKLAAHRSRIGDAVDTVRAKVEALSDERSSLLAGAIAREDYIRTVLAGIDRRADEQEERYAAHFHQCARGEIGASRVPAAIVRDALGAMVAVDSRYSARTPLFGRPLNIAGHEGDALDQLAYCFFREEIKRAATRAIERVEPWPWPDAIALKAASERIEAIDQEMATLNTELAALQAEAAEFGASI